MSDQRPPSLLSLFWTPVVAVGCSGERGANAQISVSVFGASVVPDRPRLLCVLYKANYTHELVAAKGNLSITVLSEDQLDLIPALGFSSGRDGDKLEAIEYELTPRGNPVFPGALGWLECDVIEALDLGDSTAYLSAVVENRPLRPGAPLVWSRLAPTLPSGWLETWNRKLERDIERSRKLMLWPP